MKRPSGIDNQVEPGKHGRTEPIFVNQSGARLSMGLTPPNASGTPATPAAGVSKLGLLLWKNWVVQKRHKIQTCVEIALPVFFASLLVIIRDLAPAEFYGNSTIYPDYSIAHLPFIPKTSIFNIPLPKVGAKFDAPDISQYASLAATLPTALPFDLFPSRWPLAWAPNNTAVQQVMEKLASRINVKSEGYGFANEQAMVDNIMGNYNQAFNSSSVDYLGGIVFTGEFLENGTRFSPDIKFKIRLKGSPRLDNPDRSPWSPVETWMTDFQFPVFQLPGPRYKNKTEGGNPGYYHEGFLTLQHGISRIITEMLSKRNLSNIDVYMCRYPYPPYADDKFLVALQGWLPLIIMLSFIYPALNIVKSVVHEKEKRLKESMKMMGLPNWLHWTAWFIKSFVFLVVTIIFITILLKVRWYGEGSLAVLEKSDGSLFFVFLLIFTITSISFCFLMTVFFSKANSAATGAGIIWFVSYCPYFFLQIRYATLTKSNKILACLLSNTAMAFASQLITMFEGASAGVQWETLWNGISPDDDFSFGEVLVMLVIDAIIYLFFALYIEAVFPGEFGVPKPWYFPVTKSYWCGSYYDSRLNASVTATKRPSTEFFEEEPVGLPAGIQIRGLTKAYSNKGRLAVNNLYMNVYENQITALLGHNGAGKTTTMGMLTGLFPPSGGTALVNGYDICQDIQGVRSSLGLCPQHDILFDELTVEEHLEFFCKLKGFSANRVKAESDRMIKALELEHKRQAMSCTLSGGMKRKLSVGIALCGDSKVVVLDEPTSGMDPSARRSTWDLLQAEKTGRTILLTTHFMEEADLLGDRISIMASGQIQCCGSSLFLKKKYGAGYHLVIVKDASCDVNRVTQVMRKYIPEATVDQNVGAELSYVLSSDRCHVFEPLFQELEEKREELGISSYGASVTTMEEVFIRVGEKAAEAEVEVMADDGQPGHRSRLSITKAFSRHQTPETETHRASLVGESSLPSEISTGFFKHGHSYSVQMLVENSRKQGFALFVQQLWAMLVKKAIFIVRNWILFVSQIIIPVFFLVICLIVVQTLPGVEDSRTLQPNLDQYMGTVTSVEVAANDSLAYDIAASYAQQLNSSAANKVDFVDEGLTMTDYYIEKASDDLPGVSMHYIAGLTLLPGQRAGHLKAIAWFNNQPFHAPPVTLGLLHNALLQLYTRSEDYTITVSNHPLPYDDFSKLNHDTSSNSLGFQVGFNVSFGMAFLAASFLLFLVKERVSKAKHLQYVSGVHVLTFWLANLAWDFVNFLIPCCGILLTFIAFQEDGYATAAQQGRMLLLFVVFGWAMLPLMYLFSFMFSIPASGFTRITMFNIFTGMATLITVVILQIPELDLTNAAEILDWVFLVLPNYSLGMGFNNLYTNTKAVEYCTNIWIQMACESGMKPNPCCKSTGKCGSSPCVQYNENLLGWEGLGIGRMLVFLTVDGCIFFLILLLVEMKVCERIKYYLTGSYTQPPAALEDERIDAENGEIIVAEDSDVAKERDLILGTPLSTLLNSNNLVIRELSKYYDGNFLAVNRLCLGVRRGECFGLLGVNGAGKTTTFKMLTGDALVSSGDAFLDGYSIRGSIKEVQRRLGYCPQFDATIEEMTGRETLRMFARLRGVDEGRIEALIEDLTDKFLLREHIHKQVKDLSGGNKRKLSTAVALVGDPPIVFLDEPTTGMDPVARRQLWDTIAKVRDNGQAIVLTSHSMEECEALCTRLAIMVNGQFKCLGSPQHLKNKFGQGYTVIAKVRGTPAETREEPLNMASGAEPKSGAGEVRLRSGSQRSTQAVVTTTTPTPIPDMGPLMDYIQTSFPGCQLKDYHQGLVHYHVPDRGLSWARVFGVMESAKVRFQIEDYSVGQTTLEQVFLNFAKSQVSDEVPPTSKWAICRSRQACAALAPSSCMCECLVD